MKAADDRLQCYRDLSRTTCYLLNVWEEAGRGFYMYVGHMQNLRLARLT